MDGPGRASPYEEDYELPMYDEEVLYHELTLNVRAQETETIRSHMILTDDLKDMEELPMFLTIKYCIVVAAVLTAQDWDFAQRAQCTAERYWRILFEAACDRGDMEAYVTLDSLRGFLNRLEIMRVRAGAAFLELPDLGHNFDEGDTPPAYSTDDPYTLPPYDVLGELLRTEIRRKAVELAPKPERARRKSMMKKHAPKTLVFKSSPSMSPKPRCSDSKSLVVVLKRKRSCSSAIAMPRATRLRSSCA